MVIIITGASHVGKTILAQRMLEKYKYPYFSIDHLKMGLIRSGITDFTPEDDDELTDYLWPIVREIIKTAIENEHVNQIELHPFFSQYAAIENMKGYGTVPQAWAPLAEGKHGIFTHPLLSAIGEKYGKTAAQVALKWNAQRGVSIIPKSVHKERMEQNIDIWDFSLTAEDMKQIDALDIGHSEIIDHNNPEVVRYILSAKSE
ncbi:aldo/keto reductase [Fibrobacter sp.]|uniref:aldo/keto reductase n=2 Tax=Fibrobacter TaxID=832 RepID=UPI0025BC7D61|nr:aldo/keto reductase [Fibrobacter sp.]MBR2095974.1 aldo/keto reductase [Fibrobacter sp.]MBR3072387.1 aldo/keto reductase [Fibrobacter sp.]MBR6944155.1 aldo/keto reductase [Fibrobacter sp.]